MLAGGGAEVGENATDTAVRELFEEAGYQAGNLELLTVIEVISDRFQIEKLAGNRRRKRRVRRARRSL